MSVSKYKKLCFCVVSWFCYEVGLVMGSSNEKGSGSSRELDHTPTWAVAFVCTVFILISITMEKSLHKVGMWLQQRHKKSLLEALEKVKAELMILGFISLLLTFGQRYIVRICIPAKVANKLLPCPLKDKHRTKLVSYEHRYLSEDTTSLRCKGRYVPLLSVTGLHQLHLLLFFLAILHVLYSAVTMLLGRLKIRGWKAWEEEIASDRFEFDNDRSRFQFTHDTPFVRAHATFWTRYSVFFYIGCFFRQFYRSVRKADYVTLRNGFITVHLAPGSKFNFQKYIKRSLEDDFKLVVGISPVLWASFVVFLLLNFNGLQAMYWASLIPLIIILVVGTKLQATLANMAIEITDRHAVVQGMPLVQGSDKYFWFGRPQLILHLIHFALFQYSFGKETCVHAGDILAIVKVALGYITLPLYALVTQMGSTMKKSIFDEQTKKALKKWLMDAKKNKGSKAGKSTVRTADGSTNGSTIHSSGPTLHRFKTTGHSTRTRTISPDYNQDDHHSDIEMSPMLPTSSLIVRVDHGDQEAKENEHQV
ncbi:hypothetical protein TanjilG_03784 [Lupinus angustifolius]|uniref:MLO-like protein n=1 Tax=Lupinus angustifolius TaxID=3871 RepID=A0A1J7G089_LUPAN|nr:hypothetical protein TanjilG_03784 [Lupinus angustifolius]